MKPKRQLSLFDTVSIIVGVIIGSGIYQTSPQIAALVSGPAALIACWILGGIIALIGAVCYAELTTTYPVEGGDYVYLTKAYGRPVGFLFVWSEFWIVRPGNVGLMAFVYASYAAQLLPLGPYERPLHAGLAVAALTLVNTLGVRTGKWTQNILSTVKVLGLLAVVTITFLVIPGFPSSASPLTSDSTFTVSFPTAMVLIIFTYGGWNDTAFIAAEVRDPNRNLVRSLLSGTTIVTVIYVLVNLAFLHGLGFDGLRRSPAVAADLLNLTLGEGGRSTISVLVCISCLGAINAMLFAGARIYYAVGLRQRWFSWLGKWNAQFDAPIRPLLLQGGVVLGMVIGFGLYNNGFERLVLFTSMFFFFFFLLVAISLFVLRQRFPHETRPFRVPAFPVTPLLFCAACAFMLYSTVRYALSQDFTHGFYNEGYWGISVIATGIALASVDWWLERRQHEAAAP